MHVTYEYQLSAQQLTQEMVGEYLTFFQNYTRSKLSIAKIEVLRPQKMIRKTLRFFFTSFLRSKIHVKFFEKKGNSTFKEFW